MIEDLSSVGDKEKMTLLTWSSKQAPSSTLEVEANVKDNQPPVNIHQ